jgi:hypothetical protein
MKKNIVSLFTLFLAFAAILVLTDVSYAQRNSRKARGRNYTKAEVKAIIHRVEERVDNFKDNYDESLDRSSLNGTNKEDWLNRRAKDLELATDDLSRKYDNSDSWSENKNEVRKCMDIATDIHKNMKSKRYDSKTETNWNRVVYELNTLAKLYNLPEVGSRAY